MLNQVIRYSIPIFICAILISFPLGLFGQETMHIDDSLIINKVKYRVRSEDPGYMYLSRYVPVGSLKNDINSWNLFLEKEYPSTDSNGEPLLYGDYSWRLYPVFSHRIKKQIKKCFSKKEVTPLLNDNFRMRFYPCGTRDKKILGFWQIKIVSDGLVSQNEILSMKFLGDVIKLMEDKLPVDSKGLMEKYDFKSLNGTGSIAIFIKEDGRVDVAFSDY